MHRIGERSRGPGEAGLPGRDGGRSSASRLGWPAAAAVALCFFLSGAAGLAYEIVWMRQLGLIFGHTIFAITTVLAAFMAGLALGASLLGRLIDRGGRPLLVYALLEIGIGLFALAVPPLLGGVQTAYVALYRALVLGPQALALVQFALVFPILLVPTTLMGGTLPVITRLFVDRLDWIGVRFASLYALNTFGAVAGVAAAGFVLLPAIGVWATTWLAAAANVGIGLVALAVDRRLARAVAPVPSFADGEAAGGDAAGLGDLEGARPVAGPARAATAHMSDTARVARLVVAGVAVSGALSMVYEIAWTRAIRLAVGSSVYAFSAMLTTFLVGLAVGSALFGLFLGRRAPSARLFGWLQIVVGATALAAVPLFEQLPDVVVGILVGGPLGPRGALLAQFAASFLVMIVPTTVIGAAVPCAVHAAAAALPRLGRDVGRVYAANTLGTIAGAVLAGFVLVPRLGAQASMTGAALASVVLGAAVVSSAPSTRPAARWLAAAALGAGAVVAGLIPRWEPAVMAAGAAVYGPRFGTDAGAAARFRDDARARQVLFHRDGLNATVTVERSEWGLALKVDGKVDASNGVDMPTQLMVGHLPLLLHPSAERVLVIGLGSGVTAAAVARHPTIRDLDVIEMEPAVVEASRFFQAENGRVLEDPRVRLVLADGRTFLLATSERYDAIISEPSNPWLAGVANLFSTEFYRLVRDRLADDGIVVQWVQGYNLFPADFRMILRTFRQVFPHATVWRTLNGDYLLAATKRARPIDFADLSARVGAVEAVRRDLALLAVEEPLDLFGLFLLDEAGLARAAAGGLENTDDQPRLEFNAPLALHASTVHDNAAMIREARRAELPAIIGLPPDVLEARRVRLARLLWASGEPALALEHLDKAPPPGDVGGHVERARLLLALGEVRRAAAGLERAAGAGPADPLVASYRRAAEALLRRGLPATLASEGRTRSGSADQAEAHNNLGMFYIGLGIESREAAFFDLAADALEIAAALAPANHAVLNNVGNAYFEQGRFGEAARAYERALAVRPDLAQTHFNLGLVYERQGAREQAVWHYLTAARLAPSWAFPRQNLQRLGAGGRLGDRTVPGSPGSAPRPGATGGGGRAERP